MLAKTPAGTQAGNLTEVFRELADDAERTMNARVARARPIEAELSEEAKPDWYLVHTFPGDDVRAARWLARRRFGIFRPMQQRRDKRNDAKLLQGWEPAFPGWVFVFCWDIKKMHRRILTCPGVMGILSDRVTHKPVAIDQPDEKGLKFIDKLRALSWVYDDNAVAPTHATVQAERHVKRATCKLGKRDRKALKKLKKQVKAQLKWDSSTWERANELEPHERIALLQRALNAPPSGTHQSL